MKVSAEGCMLAAVWCVGSEWLGLLVERMLVERMLDEGMRRGS